MMDQASSISFIAMCSNAEDSEAAEKRQREDAAHSFGLAQAGGQA